ncbi:hypothetical protein H0H81_008375 [Sphagnurus paluster]|uniref:Uncharacterized protein n=1 Tax=Sphagnurus paluster TaxID=117069 RepID=A0A9P7KK98_9AGAR|nr:hypothetical protein H0H81_008375 [Sphagnurus paluster]
MSRPTATFPYTDAQPKKKAGLLGDGVSEAAAETIKDMREHLELLRESFNFFPRHTTLTTFRPGLSLFALQCINSEGHKLKSANSSPSDVSTASSAPDTTIVSKYGLDRYERINYYNGISGAHIHEPELLYHSDLHTTPFPKPVGRHGYIPVKSIHGIFETPLHRVWDTVSPQILDVLKARKIQYSSIDPVRFVTHGEDEIRSRGPAVVWVGVIPGSTSPDTAHEASQEILALLLQNGVDDAVVEWREAVVVRLLDTL